MTTRKRAQSETLDLEVRFATEGDAGTFSGHAAIFDEANSFGEVVKRGAFKKTLAEHRSASTRPVMLWAHDPGDVIGVWTDIREDEKGLAVTGQLVTSTTRGAEAHELLKAGAVNGLSIGFRARGDKRGPNGVRELTDIELLEISLVPLPAASKARVRDVRSHTALADFVSACRRTSETLRRKEAP